MKKTSNVYLYIITIILWILLTIAWVVIIIENRPIGDIIYISTITLVAPLITVAIWKIIKG